MNGLSARLRAVGVAVEGLLLSERAYVVAGVVLVVYTVVGVINLSCAGTYADFWEHLAFMRAFALNPFHPGNPYSLSPFPFQHHSPYHLFWGLACRGLDLDPFSIAPFIGAVNVGFFVVAVRLFADRIVGDRRFALPFLLALLFLWWLPWEWSGFYNFGLLHLTAIYPYRFALPLSLVAISLYPGRSTAAFLGFALAAGATVLIHALTGSFLMVSFAVIALVEAWNGRSARHLIWLGPPVIGFALALFWPYFPLLDMIWVAGASGTPDYRLFYEGAFMRILPAVPGVYAIYRGLRNRELTYITLGFVAVFSIYAVNYPVLRIPAFSRYIIYVAFFLHVGVAVLLRTVWGHRSRRLFVGAFVALIAWGGLWECWAATQYLGVAQDMRTDAKLGSHGDRRLLRELRRTIGPHLAGRDVVWSRAHDSLMLPVVFGCRVLTIKRGWEPAPPLPRDVAAQRIDAEDRFFNDGSTAEARIAVLRRLGATRVFVSPEDQRFLRGMEPELHLVAQAGDRLLYGIVPR